MIQEPIIIINTRPHFFLIRKRCSVKKRGMESGTPLPRARALFQRQERKKNQPRFCIENVIELTRLKSNERWGKKKKKRAASSASTRAADGVRHMRAFLPSGKASLPLYVYIKRSKLNTGAGSQLSLLSFFTISDEKITKVSTVK